MTTGGRATWDASEVSAALLVGGVLVVVASPGFAR